MREEIASARGPVPASAKPSVRIAPFLGLVLGLGYNLVMGHSAAAEELSRDELRQELSGDQLRVLLSGNVVQGTTDGINDITVKFTADGRLAGRAENILLVDEDTGVWEIEGDTLCVTWTSWADAERNCLHVEQRGDRYESFTEDHSMRSVFRLANPQTQVGATENPLDKVYSTFPAAFGAER